MGQDWDPDRYRRHAGFVAELGSPLLDLLAPKPGERILDLGCGDGTLTARIAAAGASVVGLDRSAAQAAAARQMGLDAVVADAAGLPFVDSFDAVFSNAVLHWVRPPEAPIAGAWQALRPGGRFVAELGGHRCVERIRRALIAALDSRGIDGAAVDPWFFPTVDDYRVRLERAGFDVRSIQLIDRPTPLPTDLRGWLQTFAGPFTTVLAPGDRDAYLEEVVERLRPDLCDATGRWTADYTRLRFAAERPRSGDAARAVVARVNTLLPDRSQS